MRDKHRNVNEFQSRNSGKGHFFDSYGCLDTPVLLCRHIDTISKTNFFFFIN